MYRLLNLSKVKKAVKDTIEMQKRYPEIIAGFDLVKSLTYIYVKKKKNTEIQHNLI